MPRVYLIMKDWSDIYEFLQPREPLFCPEKPSLTQKTYLRCSDMEALFGGAAGGGKSSALLMAALQYVDIPNYSAILFRRTYADLAAFAPDVMHIGGPVALGAWGLSAARRLGVPSVALYQTDFPRFARHYKVGAAEGLAWRWLRRIHSMAEVTLAPSSAAAWDLRRNGVPRVRLWGRGVDADRFQALFDV